MPTLAEFLSIKKTNNWFVILKDPEDFQEFEAIIRRVLEEAQLNRESLVITVERKVS